MTRTCTYVWWRTTCRLRGPTVSDMASASPIIRCCIREILRSIRLTLVRPYSASELIWHLYAKADQPRKLTVDLNRRRAGYRMIYSLRSTEMYSSMALMAPCYLFWMKSLTAGFAGSRGACMHQPFSCPGLYEKVFSPFWTIRRARIPLSSLCYNLSLLDFDYHVQLTS